MSSLNERIFGSVQRKLRYSDASSADSPGPRLDDNSPTLSCILREHTAELHRQASKEQNKEQRVARRPALRDRTNCLEKVSKNGASERPDPAHKAKVLPTSLRVAPISSKTVRSCNHGTQRVLKGADARAAAPVDLGAETQRLGHVTPFRGCEPAGGMGQEKESFSGAYLSNGDPSRDPVSEVRQRTDTLPKTSSIQSSRHRAEIAKRDAQIASLQQRCAQLELDLADDRQLEQLLDEYREKLDSAAEENRLLADALEVERRNQQVLRDKITTYKERLATWPAKLATEMRMLESKHELSAKEARLLAQRLEAEKRQLQDELQRSWDTVASLRSELEQARAASVEATQKQLETVRRECEQAHRQSLIKLEAEFDAYRSEAKLALERWHTRCIEMERELTELSELVAYYRGKSEDLASSHEAFEQRTRNQEMRLNAALQRESSRAACLETEVEALQNRIGDLQAVIDELETGATLRTEYARARRCPPAYHTVDANEP